MSLLVLGINHKTAPVSLREKVAFSPENLVDALLQLKQIDVISGVVIVSTCNRTEIYCEQDDAHAGVLIDWLVTFHQLDNQELLDSLYIHQDSHAVRHLMRVAAGLDSLVLGEPQILGQVKQAYALSVEHQAVSGALERLFHGCFMVAKKVRTETDIGGSAVSVAFAACSLAKQIFESLEKSTVLLVGAGETVELVAKHLYEQKCRQIIVANRSRERAEPFAAAFGAQIILLEDIPHHMYHADIVISSTAAPLPIIGKGMVEKALKARRQQPMLLIDIAVPRDIEAQVADLDDAYLYTVDDLHSIVERNLAQRKAAAVQAEAIITTEVHVFMTWLRSRSSVGSIRAYRTQADELKTALINKSLQALANGADPQQVVVELGNKLTNKLIHAPTQAMQHAAKLGDEQTLMTLRHCLGLDPQK